jgi:hypothetical protein
MRQHFRIEPWTDFVEVSRDNRGQAYVIPVGSDRISVAMIGNEKKVSVLELTGLLSRACETPPARRADRGSARRDDNVREIDDSRQGAGGLGRRCIRGSARRRRSRCFSEL